MSLLFHAGFAFISCYPWTVCFWLLRLLWSPSIQSLQVCLSPIPPLTNHYNTIINTTPCRLKPATLRTWSVGTGFNKAWDTNRLSSLLTCQCLIGRLSDSDFGKCRSLPASATTRVGLTDHRRCTPHELPLWKCLLESGSFVIGKLGNMSQLTIICKWCNHRGKEWLN